MEVPTTMDTKLADQDELLALEATQDRSGCQHHWVIDSPAGPVSKGACRSCGEERNFPNYIKDATFRITSTTRAAGLGERRSDDRTA